MGSAESDDVCMAEDYDGDDISWFDWDEERRFKKSRYSEEILESYPSEGEEAKEEHLPDLTCVFCTQPFGGEENVLYQRPYAKDAKGKIHAVCDSCHGDRGGLFTPIEYSKTVHKVECIKLV